MNFLVGEELKNLNKGQGTIDDCKIKLFIEAPVVFHEVLAMGWECFGLLVDR